MRVARVIVALVLIVGASATADPAAAQEPGVTIDPGSPAGKEYGFPLDVQRAAAGGREAIQGVAQPLFGVGVTPSGAGVRSGTGGRAGTGGRFAAPSGGSRAGRPANSKGSPAGKGT